MNRAKATFHCQIKPLRFAALFLLFAASGWGARGADTLVYGDALDGGWQNWSWNTTLQFGSASPVYAGSAALRVSYTAAWAGVYLHAASALDASRFTALRFQAHGGSAGGQKVRVVVYDSAGAAVGGGVVLTLAAGSWTSVTLSLADLGGPATIGGLVWQEAAGLTPPAFSLDDITLVGAGVPPMPTPTPTPAPGPALSVNAAAGSHAISPLIYGMNFADEGLAAELRLPVRRWGGNSTTRYNWQNDTSNHASDWFFENIPNDNNNPGALPDGSSSDLFIDQDRRTGTKTIMTLPLIGWTPKSRAYAGGFSVAKYGPQQQTDSWRPDCGNGLRPDGTPIAGNDPLDTSAAIGPDFVSQWVGHLVGRYGTAASGGVAFYNLDNEPMLWNSTHCDVHPAATSYDEIRDRTWQYAAAIKSADPTAATLGPVVWGWTAYFYSALDATAGGSWWNNPPDRTAHGGVPFIEWYLQQMRAYEQSHGVRILDYLDVHYYPQAAGVALAGAGDAQTQALRLRATRALWDGAYSDESWIGESVQLIPRMRDWVARNYPGTKLAVSEYNWGALDHINGALAQADVLGIFGREGLDLATLWGPPTADQPGAFAFRIYRNYDGAGGSFGDQSVQAASSDQDRLAIYAARRSGDGALTLVIINKSGADLTADLALNGFSPARRAAVYHYDATALMAIIREADLAVSPAGFQRTYPRSSISLVVLGPATQNGACGWMRYQ